MINSPCVGNNLERLVAQASCEVFLVAPFIKRDAFARVIAGVKKGVRVTCVTRWRLPEIIAGVSDPDIWEIVRCLDEGVLLVNHSLHAKYYRGDDLCLIGSANLTGAALGWSANPNWELLMAPDDVESLRGQFEEELLELSTRVDDSLYRIVAERVRVAKEQTATVADSVELGDLYLGEAPGGTINDYGFWLPQLRHPDALYLAYRGETSVLTNAARAASRVDLNQFVLSAGLDRGTFEAEVAIQLLGKSMVKQVDRFVSQPRRFGEVRQFLKEAAGEKEEVFDPGHAWQTLMRWLLYFLPNRYKMAVPSHSEIFYRMR
jgi:hypothetical protein